MPNHPDPQLDLWWQRAWDAQLTRLVEKSSLVDRAGVAPSAPPDLTLEIFADLGQPVRHIDELQAYGTDLPGSAFFSLDTSRAVFEGESPKKMLPLERFVSLLIGEGLSPELNEALLRQYWLRPDPYEEPEVAFMRVALLRFPLGSPHRDLALSLVDTALDNPGEMTPKELERSVLGALGPPPSEG